MNQRLRKYCRARGAGDFRRALEHRLYRHQICAAQCRAADLSRDPHGLVVGLMAIIVAVARPRWPDRIGIAPQRRRRHSGARILSGRHGDRDRAFDSGRALGADSGPAADPDLDDRKPLARRARHAAAMDRVVARARRRRADPARSADERRGGLGLARLGRVAGQHHAWARSTSGATATRSTGVPAISCNTSR